LGLVGVPPRPWTCAQTQSLLGLVPLPKHRRWRLGIELSMLVVGLGAIIGSGGYWGWWLVRYEPVLFLLKILTGTDPSPVLRRAREYRYTGVQTPRAEFW